MASNLPPLIERVDVPDNSLDKNLHLLHGYNKIEQNKSITLSCENEKFEGILNVTNESTEDERSDFVHHNRIGRSVAFEYFVRKNLAYVI